MRYRALVTDYDGTLATHGEVGLQTIAALERFLRSGRLLVMATGRRLDDLQSVFSRLDLFSLVIAENGALLYDPATNKEELLCEPAPGALVAALQEQGVPVSVGRAVVATVEPHQQTVRKTILDLGLPYAVSLNKGSIMVLPEGVSKLSALRPALTKLGLTEESVVGIGDAENDLDFIAACGCGVAVANATPELKSRADFVTAHTHGDGVAEIIDRLIACDCVLRQC